MDEKKKGVDASIEDDREVWVLQMGQQCHEGKSFKQQRTCHTVCGIAEVLSVWWGVKDLTADTSV